MFDLYKQFVGKTDPPNRFWKLDESAVSSAELRMGYRFPSGLRSFFLEAGHGFFGQGTDDIKRTHVNRILSPKTLCDLLLDEDNPQRPAEGFPEGVLPFFDLGEQTYLMLLPNSESPNSVYSPSGRKVIARDIEDFFARLYLNADFYRQYL